MSEAEAYCRLGLRHPAAFERDALAEWERARPRLAEEWGPKASMEPRQIGRTTRMLVSAAIAAASEPPGRFRPDVVILAHDPHYARLLADQCRRYAERLGWRRDRGDTSILGYSWPEWRRIHLRPRDPRFPPDIVFHDHHRGDLPPPAPHGTRMTLRSFLASRPGPLVPPRCPDCGLRIASRSETITEPALYCQETPERRETVRAATMPGRPRG